MNNLTPQTPDAVVQRVMEKVNQNYSEILEFERVTAISEVVEETQIGFLKLAYLFSGGKDIWKMLNERSLVGIEKYGTTLEHAILSKEQVLQHAVEEFLDAANYLEKLLSILQNQNTNEK